MDDGSEARPRARFLFLQPGVRGLLLWLWGIPLVGNFNVLCSVYTTLHSVPPGTSVRPMGLALWLGLVSVGTAVCGVGLGGLTAFLWRKVPLLLLSGCASAALSLTPFWVGTSFFRWFAATRGLILSD
ncbi:MAG TPA: hypothetical protein VM222_04675 [Planctomycetota bacterium]|nr:hypothetical protein [Planctomycetota bacterium]